MSVSYARFIIPSLSSHDYHVITYHYDRDDLLMNQVALQKKCDDLEGENIRLKKWYKKVHFFEKHFC